MFGPGTKCRCASCSQLPDDCTYIVIAIATIARDLYYHQDLFNDQSLVIPDLKVQLPPGGGVGSMRAHFCFMPRCNFHFLHTFTFICCTDSFYFYFQHYTEACLFPNSNSCSCSSDFTFTFYVIQRSLFIKFFFQLQVFVQCASILYSLNSTFTFCFKIAPTF